MEPEWRVPAIPKVEKKEFLAGPSVRNIVWAQLRNWIDVTITILNYLEKIVLKAFNIVNVLKVWYSVAAAWRMKLWVIWRMAHYLAFLNS